MTRGRGWAEKASAGGREFHVSPKGSDRQDGTLARPLKTISAAAAVAMPGDTITVHEGVYRERVAPPRGGISDEQRIVYRAAPGERAEITGAEIVKGWSRWRGDVWTVTIPNSFFGAFNPYRDVIHGDWFDPRGRVHHTGAVYLNGDWLAEAASLDQLADAQGAIPLWFGRVDRETTTLWAQFGGADPNHEQTEINVRQTVFYPEKTGMDFITVRGFILRCAATPWAPPTAEQIGVIGPHWSKGWIIENNTVSHSICSGISLGKYGDAWDNTSANTAQGYVKTIDRALSPAGRRNASVTTSSGTIQFPTANRPASLAASGRCSAWSPAIRFTTFTCASSSAALKSPGSNSMPPLTWKSATTISFELSVASGSTGWRKERMSPETSSTTTRVRTCSSRSTTDHSSWTTIFFCRKDRNM